MKKFYKSLIVGAALSAAVAVNASAADFTNCADVLNQMGLFKGTETGYELDRSPTRGEAATMLVRLLGKETEALEKNYQTPFTDVPDWAKPYVGWLYENKLTNGTSDTTYSTSSACTAQMYSTFLLRTLGYSDTAANPDFTYNNAIDFAKQKGVVDMANCDEDNFLRDHVVAMSYTTLATEPKDAKYDNLLDKLVADGAIDSTKAKPFQDKFDIYDEYAELVEKNANITNMDADIKMDMSVKMNNASVITMNMNSNVKTNMNLEQFDKSKFLVTGDTKIVVDSSILGSATGENSDETIETKINAYYADGMYYVSGDGQKIKMPMSFDQMLESLDMQTLTKREPISSIDTLSKDTNGTYNVSYSASYLNSAVDSLLVQIGMTVDDVNMSIDKVDMTITPENGQIKAMTADMVYTMNVQGQEMVLDMNLDYDILKTGSSVVITAPTDLDSYVDIMNSLT